MAFGGPGPELFWAGPALMATGIHSLFNAHTFSFATQAQPRGTPSVALMLWTHSRTQTRTQGREAQLSLSTSVFMAVVHSMVGGCGPNLVVPQQHFKKQNSVEHVSILCR